MVYPPLWHPDQILEIVAPASGPRYAERLERGLNALTADGYLFNWDPENLSRHRYLSNSDAQRAEQFNQAFARSRYLVAVRGGYGCLRILDRIDYTAAKNLPGVLIGFSDITALQLSLFARSGWRSISGPVVVEWDEITPAMKEEVKRLLTGELAPAVTGLKTMREGQCTATLLGGNLSMIVRMVGSGYLPDLTGKLLFIEDVNEPPYRIDALLTQLRNAGILEDLGGLILGNFTGKAQSTRNDAEMIVLKTILDCVDRYSWPVVTGLEYGHMPSRRVLPIGVSATLTAHPDGGCLEILEPVVGKEFSPSV